MEYEIRNGKVCERLWYEECCCPTPKAVESMYDAGLKMYINNKVVKRQDAVKICEDAYNKRKGKK